MHKLEPVGVNAISRVKATLQWHSPLYHADDLQ